MTYCLAMNLNDGMVFGADSRTNAGVDQVSTFRKLRLYHRDGERVLVLLSAGNLAVTQAVANEIDKGVGTEDPDKSLMHVDSMFNAARIVGNAVRKVHSLDAKHLRDHGADFSISLLLGGQIKGEEQRLFLIYSAGNFIEASPVNPYFQIGETKYGKPIIDRVIKKDTKLDDAAKCALLSFDSTIKSNISVGLPIDLLVYRRDTFKVAAHQWIEEDDSYFKYLHDNWGQGLRNLFQGLNDPPWTME